MARWNFGWNRTSGDDKEWRGKAFDDRKCRGKAVLKYLSWQGNTISDDSWHTPQAARGESSRTTEPKPVRTQAGIPRILYVAQILQQTRFMSEKALGEKVKAPAGCAASSDAVTGTLEAGRDATGWLPTRYWNESS